jgi:FtsH-binding integral membrane protein
MNIRKSLGFAIMFSPLAGVFVLAAAMEGVVAALCIFGILSIVVAVVVGGSCLIDDAPEEKGGRP